MNYKQNSKLYIEAAELFIKSQNPSLSLLRVYLKLSESDAAQIMEDFVKAGFISEYRTGNTRILTSVSDLLSALESQKSDPLRPVTKTQETKAGSNISFDDFEGHAFEYFCADLLKYNGFERIKVTAGSKDYGVDILCEKEGIPYAIQCKCYKQKVSNKAVQEAVAGKIFYKCKAAAVMTNSTFTAAALETARMTNTILWERSHIKVLLSNALQNGYIPKKY